MTTLTITSVTTTNAGGTLTSDNTNVSDGDTVTIDTKTYTFKTALTPTEGQVKIGTNADATLLNLVHAVNHTGVNYTAALASSAEYYCAKAHLTVRANGVVSAHAVAFTALTAGTAANAIATTEASSHLSWGAATLTGGSNSVTLAGTISAVTYSQPAQMTTVGEFPAANTLWSRFMTLASQALFVNRNGASGLALTLASLGIIGRAIERTLTWQPVIITQPSAVSNASYGGGAKTMSVVAASEPTPTYQWQYSPDTGATWSSATGAVRDVTYANDTTAILSITPAGAATVPSMSGRLHRCVVTNGAGATESDAAVLTIT